jgi:hypothetical protein
VFSPCPSPIPAPETMSHCLCSQQTNDDHCQIWYRSELAHLMLHPDHTQVLEDWISAPGVFSCPETKRTKQLLDIIFYFRILLNFMHKHTQIYKYNLLILIYLQFQQDPWRHLPRI